MIFRQDAISKLFYLITTSSTDAFKIVIWLLLGFIPLSDVCNNVSVTSSECKIVVAILR